MGNPSSSSVGGGRRGSTNSGQGGSGQPGGSTNSGPGGSGNPGGSTNSGHGGSGNPGGSTNSGHGGSGNPGGSTNSNQSNPGGSTNSGGSKASGNSGKSSRNSASSKQSSSSSSGILTLNESFLTLTNANAADWTQHGVGYTNTTGRAVGDIVVESHVTWPESRAGEPIIKMGVEGQTIYLKSTTVAEMDGVKGTATVTFKDTSGNAIKSQRLDFDVGKTLEYAAIKATEAKSDWKSHFKADMGITLEQDISALEFQDPHSSAARARGALEFFFDSSNLDVSLKAGAVGSVSDLGDANITLDLSASATLTIDGPKTSVGTPVFSAGWQALWKSTTNNTVTQTGTTSFQLKNVDTGNRVINAIIEGLRLKAKSTSTNGSSWENSYEGVLEWSIDF
jgi:hypothetical protein